MQNVVFGKKHNDIKASRAVPFEKTKKKNDWQFEENQSKVKKKDKYRRETRHKQRETKRDSISKGDV